MKTLSIRQPWAELILQGRKTIELRTWHTSYRGPLLIHAGAKIEREACVAYGLDPHALVRGALVGTPSASTTATSQPSRLALLRRRRNDGQARIFVVETPQYPLQLCVEGSSVSPYATSRGDRATRGGKVALEHSCQAHLPMTPCIALSRGERGLLGAALVISFRPA